MIAYYVMLALVVLVSAAVCLWQYSRLVDYERRHDAQMRRRWYGTASCGNPFCVVCGGER